MSDIEALDCRGLQCPRPVVMARKALDEIAEGDVRVMVSLPVQVTNLVQLAEAAGWSAESEASGGHFLVTIHKTGPAASAEPAPAPATSTGSATFLCASDELGHGDADLGRLLTQLLLRTLADSDETPLRLLFMNTGVRLCCEGSPILDALEALRDRGTDVLACGTCLDYLGLLDSLRVGRVTNMHDLLGFLVSASPLVALT